MATEGSPTPAVDALLAGLNPPQQEAVTHGDGPLLIFAGAGSGKTRVLTARIAYLIATHRVWPDRLLAVTFTNKAAREMRSRVETLVGEGAEKMWVGTFHSTAVKILRREAQTGPRRAEARPEALSDRRHEQRHLSGQERAEGTQ
jgi:DNA helicase-2/ATP-dependent DNA helicase PcrA